MVKKLICLIVLMVRFAMSLIALCHDYRALQGIKA